MSRLCMCVLTFIYFILMEADYKTLMIRTLDRWNLCTVHLSVSDNVQNVRGHGPVGKLSRPK